MLGVVGTMGRSASSHSLGELERRLHSDCSVEDFVPGRVDRLNSKFCSDFRTKSLVQQKSETVQVRVIGLIG